MNVIRIILVVIWKLWFYFLAIFAMLVLTPFALIFTFKDSHFPITYKIIRIWSYIVFFGSGFRYNLIKNTELKKNQQYIVISNHTSILDIVLLFIVHPNHLLTFVGKKELDVVPIFGQIYKRTCILVDRKNFKSRAKVYELSKEKIKLNSNIVIFPEGGVPDDTTIVLDKFKDGAFNIAISESLPLAIYAIKGLKNSFPFEFTKGFPAKIVIELIEITPTISLNESNKEELKANSFRVIHDNLLK